MAEKILIIDDDRDVVEITKDTLEYGGYEVVFAYDGQSGLDLAKKEKPDLVILDIMMPGGMSGYAVCEKMKADKSIKHIPVLILTAKNMMRDLEQALEKGADWYISKPYDINYLLRNVNKLIQRSKGVITETLTAKPEIKNVSKKKKVLIIDDDRDAIDTTRETLEFGGYEVICAVDGMGGLEKLKNEKPDLVVLDIIMPGGIDGYEVCRKIKTDPATKSIPVLMLTAKDMGEDVEKALERGANWYISKPYDIDFLLRNVQKLLDRNTN